MTSGSRIPRCVVCDTRMVKNGKTTAGTTRWRCKTCGVSQVQHGENTRKSQDTKLFVSWLFHNTPIPSLHVPRRTFYRRIHWCWTIPVPRPRVTGVVDSEILVDGIYLPYDWCLLIAMNTTHVLAWQWCHQENTGSYTALLNQLIEPDCVCLDGGMGAHAALNSVWPHVKIQRCLIHVTRNIRMYLTSKPRTDAGRSLLTLSKKLLHINSIDQAIVWEELLNRWYYTYGYLTREKTYNPCYPFESPAWWYTHERLRKAYRLLERLIKRHHLFTYLDPDLREHAVLLRSTNRLEGGPNKTIRRLLLIHPGLSESHMRCAIEWILHNLSEHPVDITEYLHNHYQETQDHNRHHDHTPHTREETIQEPQVPIHFDPGELGLHHGGAGQSQ